MALSPDVASSMVAYFTKPKPLENPDTRSVTTLAAQRGRNQAISFKLIQNLLQIPLNGKDKLINIPWTTSPNLANSLCSASLVVRLLSPGNHTRI